MSVFHNVLYKILFTLLLVFFFRFGLFLPSPGINLEFFLGFFLKNKDSSISLINFITSSSFGSFSIFSLGVMPYVMSSIIVQLGGHLFELNNSEFFRERSSQIIKICVIIFSSIQFSVLAFSDSGLQIFSYSQNLYYLCIITSFVTIVTGSLIALWIGEIITEYGIGNGVSLLIFSNITADFLSFVLRIFNYNSVDYSIFTKFFVLVFLFALIFVIVFVEKSNRFVSLISIKSSSIRNGNSSINRKNYLFPMKINFAGVMPLIFSNTILTFVYFICGKIFSGGFQNTYYFNIFYYGLFFILLLMFSFFYNEMMFNPKKVAEYFKKNDSVVVGVRPGLATEKYFLDILNKLTIIAVCYLFSIVIFVDFVKFSLNLNSFLNVTSLLIVVLMSLDFLEKIKSEFVKFYNYDYLK